MGAAILCIPRDARVRAYRTRDTYDGVVPVTSKRQPYCLSIYIELSAQNESGDICLYRENAIAIQNESGDSNGGNV